MGLLRTILFFHIAIILVKAICQIFSLLFVIYLFLVTGGEFCKLTEPATMNSRVRVFTPAKKKKADNKPLRSYKFPRLHIRTRMAHSQGKPYFNVRP